MIRFLFKGILHDKSRSLLPIIVISIGTILTVILYCWLKGIMSDTFEMSANFSAGHVKVMSKPYAKNSEQMPNDLAILGADSLVRSLKTTYPQISWVKRIRFGGLIDFPDQKGETRAQGPVVGWAIDIFSSGSLETKRFNMDKSIITGSLPKKPGEAIITKDFADKFGVKPGDKFTFIGTTMNGGMAFKNFTVAGIVLFGSAALDKGAIIMDITDAQTTLEMQDAAGEILGFSNEGIYDNEKATLIVNDFNQKHSGNKDEYAPVMVRLRDQYGLGGLLDYSNKMESIMVFVFVLAMSIVLWNAGLLGGLRRYNEFGVRLALGEDKNHIYKTLIYEAVLIGSVGSVVGTSLGLGICYWAQHTGINLGGMMKNSSLMIPTVVRTIVTPQAYFIGFIPGLISMVFGNAISGIGIYKRNTAQLFKELEV